MLIATLARKPVDGTLSHNVGLHGAGGLHVDACRVAPTGERLGGGDESSAVLDGKEGGWSRPWMHDPDKAAAFAAESRNRVEKATAFGRWPANLVLVHLAGCRKLGVGLVAGNRTDGRPKGDGGRSDTGQWRFRPTDATRRGYSEDDGTEPAEKWECAEGCPAAEMDRQSGNSRSGTGGATFSDTPARSWKNKSVAGINRVAHGDSGGASRYFNQVKR